MQKVFFLFGLLFMSDFVMAQKPTDNFSGNWKTADGNIIEITKDGSGFIGKPKGKNVVVLKNLIFSNGKWKGILINPLNNATANCEAYLDEKKIRFVVKKGMIKKDIFWFISN